MFRKLWLLVPILYHTWPWYRIAGSYFDDDGPRDQFGTTLDRALELVRSFNTYGHWNQCGTTHNAAVEWLCSFDNDGYFDHFGTTLDHDIELLIAILKLWLQGKVGFTLDYAIELLYLMVMVTVTIWYHTWPHHRMDKFFTKTNVVPHLTLLFKRYIILILTVTETNVLPHLTIL